MQTVDLRRNEFQFLAALLDGRPRTLAEINAWTGWRVGQEHAAKIIRQHSRWGWIQRGHFCQITKRQRRSIRRRRSAYMITPAGKRVWREEADWWLYNVARATTKRKDGRLQPKRDFHIDPLKYRPQRSDRLPTAEEAERLLKQAAALRRSLPCLLDRSFHSRAARRPTDCRRRSGRGHASRLAEGPSDSNPDRTRITALPRSGYRRSRIGPRVSQPTGPRMAMQTRRPGVRPVSPGRRTSSRNRAPRANGSCQKTTGRLIGSLIDRRPAGRPAWSGEGPPSIGAKRCRFSNRGGSGRVSCRRSARSCSRCTAAAGIAVARCLTRSGRRSTTRPAAGAVMTSQRISN